MTDDRLIESTKPMRYGKWLRTSAYPHHIFCSICYKSIVTNEEIIGRYKIPTNHCPNCGVKMEREFIMYEAYLGDEINYLRELTNMWLEEE